MTTETPDKPYLELARRAGPLSFIAGTVATREIQRIMKDQERHQAEVVNKAGESFEDGNRAYREIMRSRLADFSQRDEIHAKLAHRRKKEIESAITRIDYGHDVRGGSITPEFSVGDVEQQTRNRVNTLCLYLAATVDRRLENAGLLADPNNPNHASRPTTTEPIAFEDDHGDPYTVTYQRFLGTHRVVTVREAEPTSLQREFKFNLNRSSRNTEDIDELHSHQDVFFSAIEALRDTQPSS